MTHQPPWNK